MENITEYNLQEIEKKVSNHQKELNIVNQVIHYYYALTIFCCFLLLTTVLILFTMFITK